MTPEIQNWLRETVLPLRQSFGDVFEVGALNVNGSARDVLQCRARSWVGCDRVVGPGVDEIGIAAEVIGARVFDMVVACECYEHDPRFWETHAAVVAALRDGGLYVVTSPTIGFPFHDYGGDFYRFTEMAVRQMFFSGLGEITIGTVGAGGLNCVVGVAVKPISAPTRK